eukprot:TRINITY_DN5880_c0_g1_i1.p1 TRINITY_DN5880_c0_g1~~TRINITY_DN5880_c0_g1_i1.p1  ORF type:complete len:134 (-),score=47.52 TRINITY_DN5880_c0_g1_i1:94-495(-)
MKVLILAVFVLLAAAAFAEEKKKEHVRIGVTYKPPTCDRKTQRGDTLKIHYVGTLKSDGSKFDSSRDRNDPFSFKLGEGQVIAGWDQGLRGMCIGEKRRLTIPPSLGYGDSGAGDKIPGGSTLVFETELIDIV